MSGLTDQMQAARRRMGNWPLHKLTVLDRKIDPFRLDTPAHHRDGAWAAARRGSIGHKIHCRGLHYACLGQLRPDGTSYTNDEKSWEWIQVAVKYARWLSYIDFEAVTDERNNAPVITEFAWPAPEATVNAGGVELWVPNSIMPTMALEDFRAVQPYRLVFFGEKTSLERVLTPLTQRFRADLYLPAGEASDWMCHRLAKSAAEDGRKLIVFYFSDADPSGVQMCVSVSRKLQALKAEFFPDLEFELRPVMLTVEQVRRLGLPHDPLKDSDKRAKKWEAATGIGGTEIDAVATLRPDLFEQIAVEAIEPFFDKALDRRAWAVRQEWEERAQEALVASVGAEEFAALEAMANSRIESLQDDVQALNDALDVDLAGVDLPALPPAPQAHLREGEANHPLISSDDDWVSQTLGLILHKVYLDQGRRP